MSNTHNFILGVLVLYAVVVSTALLWERERSYSENNIYPISHDNMLIFSIRVNEISNSLNETVRKTNPEFPKIKFSNSSSSYKSPDQSWIMISDELILITLFRDVASVLNSIEVKAVAVHELCHVILGHIETNPLLQERSIRKEKDADNCAVNSGIDPNTLVSAIRKLAPEGEEKSQRISVLSFNLN